MLQKIIDGYCRMLSVIMAICLVIMVCMVFGNVVLRYVFNSGIAVSEEMSRWLFLWLVFLGATVAVREQGHMGTDMLIVKLSPALQRAAMVVGQLLMLWITWLMFTGSLAQTRINWDVMAPVTGLSSAWIYATGVVFAVSTGIMLLSDLWFTLRGKQTPAQVIAAQRAVEHAQAERRTGSNASRTETNSSTH